MRKKTQSIVGVSALFAVIAVVVYGYVQAVKPSPVVLQGQLEAREISVASKVSGRIADMYVEQGQRIDVGTLIFRMDSPEIAAKVAQAEAASDAASAVAAKAVAGARSYEVLMAKDQMKRAQAGLDAREKTWKRVHKLASEGLLSQQKSDEAKAAYISAKEQFNTAKSRFDMVSEGARKEDVAAAEAQARQGQAVVAEALAVQQESRLVSPVAGEVAEVIFYAGEIVAKGVPVITVVDLQRQRLEINIREDFIKNFAIGSTFTGDVPALGLNDVLFEVYASAVLPDFATWRPTRSEQGFDMKTFLVKARPVEPIEGMRPGLSVLVNLPSLEETHEAEAQ